MNRLGVSGAAVLLLSGCAANDTGPPSSLEGAALTFACVDKNDSRLKQ